MSKKKNTDFRITPYHVNNSVTGSSVLIEVDGLKILCDLGMFQSQSHKIEDIYKILPITKIIVETASFDIQKIKNPTINSTEYQKGLTFGFLKC